jgi:hypothetical protein
VITLIEAHNYRCLRYVRQPLGAFRVLVGPNASGKTTFLDVVALLGSLVVDGLESAVSERSRNFRDLLWRHEGDRFELAVEARLPEAIRQKLGRPEHEVIRYEVAFAINPESNELEIAAESGILKSQANNGAHDASAAAPAIPAGDDASAHDHLRAWGQTRSARLQKNRPAATITTTPKCTKAPAKAGCPLSGLGPRKSTLANLPEDETRFPAATWLKSMLIDGVRQYALNSRLMRVPSPPHLQRELRPDGSNLPWVVADLQRRTSNRHQGLGGTSAFGAARSAQRGDGGTRRRPSSLSCPGI